MHATTLHTQADLWQHGAATFAALFMEGEMRSPDDEVDGTGVLLYAVMNRGLRLATDLPRLALRPRPDWAAHLNSAKALTLTWPHVQPLLPDAPLNLPTGWREAAAGRRSDRLPRSRPRHTARPACSPAGAAPSRKQKEVPQRGL